MRLLIVEDDQDIAEDMSCLLQFYGLRADMAFDAKEAEYLGSVEDYALIILDMNLPLGHGLNVLKSWRNQSITTPVLVYSGYQDSHHKITALDAGADFYLDKTTDIQTLLAYIRAILKRSHHHANSIITCKDLIFEPDKKMICLSGRPLLLTDFEYRILSFLLYNKDQIVSTSQLMEQLYKHDQDYQEKTLTVVIHRLRKKIPFHYIHTIRGRGYRLSAPAQ